MSEQLEILSLRKHNEQLAFVVQKQAHSILELCGTMTEIIDQLRQINDSSTRDQMITIHCKVANTLRLSATKANNYMYMPERE